MIFTPKGCVIIKGGVFIQTLFGNKIKIDDNVLDYYIREVDLADYNLVDDFKVLHETTDEFLIAYDAEWQTRVGTKENVDVLITQSFAFYIDGVFYVITAFNKDFRDKVTVSLYKILLYINKTFGLNLAIYKETSKGRKHISLDKLKRIFKHKRSVRLIGFFNGVDLRWLDIFYSFSGYDEVNATDKNFIVIAKNCATTLHKIKLQTRLWFNKNAHECVTNMEVEDVMLKLSKTSLNKASSDFLGITKVDLTTYEKSRMLDLLVSDPVRYTEYAVKDSVLTLLLAVRLQEYFGVKGITLPQIAVKKLHAFVGLTGEAYDRAVIGFNYDADSNKYKPFSDNKNEDFVKFLDIINDTQEHTKFLKGGTNQCFTFCTGLNRPTLDVDLKSAYPGSIYLLPELDYAKEFTSFENIYIKNIPNHENIFSLDNLNNIGVAVISCVIPDNVIITEPQYTKAYNTYYTRTFKEVCVQLPQLVVLYNLGVNVYIHKLMIPHHTGKTHIVGLFAKEGVEKRIHYQKVHGKKSGQQNAQKLLNNSLYGKTAQGINIKRVSGFYDNETKNLDQSSISDPVVSSQVTALIRAIICLSLNWLENKGYTIHSVTTDGFITDASEDAVKQLNDYLMSIKCIKRMCKELELGDYLEVKHKQNILYNIKTRFNLSGLDDTNGVLATVGVKFKGEENDMEKKKNIIDKMENKEFYFTNEETTLVSLKNIKDLKLKSLTKKVAKRVTLLHDARMIPYAYDSNTGIKLRVPLDEDEYNKALQVWNDITQNVKTKDKGYCFTFDLQDPYECCAYIVRYNIAMKHRRRNKINTIDEFIANEIKVYKHFNDVSLFTGLSKDEFYNRLNIYVKQAKFAAIDRADFDRKYKNIKTRDNKCDPWINQYNIVPFLEKLKESLNETRRINRYV